MNTTYLSVELPGGLEPSVRQAVPDVVATTVTVLLVGVSIFPLREWQWQFVVSAGGYEEKTWYKLVISAGGYEEKTRYKLVHASISTYFLSIH